MTQIGRTSSFVGTSNMWQRCSLMKDKIPFPESSAEVQASTVAFVMSATHTILGVTKAPTAAWIMLVWSGCPRLPPPHASYTSTNSYETSSDTSSSYITYTPCVSAFSSNATCPYPNPFGDGVNFCALVPRPPPGYTGSAFGCACSISSTLSWSALVLWYCNTSTA